MKSFNDLWIKSNSFYHLREQSNESPFPRCPITGSWQLFPPHLDTIRHFLSVELLPTKSNPVIVLPSLSMCFVSQLEMFQHLIPWVILYSSIFEKINPSRVSFRCHRMDEDLKSEDVKINVCNESTTLWGVSWIMKIMLACVSPFTLPYAWISGRDSCLVGGELSQPQFSPCLTLLVHHSIMFKFQRNLKWGLPAPLASMEVTRFN